MSELDRLRDRVEDLEHLLGITEHFPRVLCPAIKGKFRRGFLDPILGLLLARAYVPKEAMYEVLYGMRAEAEQPRTNVISVNICILRKVLKSHGIAITNIWGKGYYLTADDKAKLRALIEQSKAAAA